MRTGNADDPHRANPAVEQLQEVDEEGRTPEVVDPVGPTRSARSTF